MIERTFIGLVVIMAALLLYIAMKPDNFHFSRRTLIHMPAEAIFPYGNNFKKMNLWNPWMRMDPNIVIMEEGPAEGVGAVTRWKGNKEVGAGTATIIASVPNKIVRISLQYQEPFVGSSISTLELEPEGAETRVTWSNDGKSSFMMRAMSLFFDMDKMMDSLLDRGLADLKTQVEAAPAQPKGP